jgi:hypothetical protein
MFKRLIGQHSEIDHDSLFMALTGLSSELVLCCVTSGATRAPRISYEYYAGQNTTSIIVASGKGKDKIVPVHAMKSYGEVEV